ncbi:hypothetical protein ZOSMA_15G00670 [Zostera marina]|uniref:Uncharacterized protein n=1 Tax=Zostera marina TaxID=29655 RepID=A0A0K9PUW7_ZOSMR|nr:hypothetical protein ZOSMA_15G00670 [Zostera marina]
MRAFQHVTSFVEQLSNSLCAIPKDPEVAYKLTSEVSMKRSAADSSKPRRIMVPWIVKPRRRSVSCVEALRRNG